MKIVIPPLEVAEDDLFQVDLFNRKPFAESLLNLVKSTNESLVISINGEWGEGKTTFIKQWQTLLNESKIPNMYIDAFSNDFLDDAFITVTSEIAHFAEENTDNNSKVSDFKKTAVNVGTKLLSWSAKIAVKTATIGTIKDSDIEELEAIKNDISSGASSVIGGLIDDRFKSHKKDLALVETFQKLLSELPNQINKDNDLPLIIIIDELDRCKPSFAVEILEKIKHLFSVENIFFVLVMNKKQLEESVKCIYGQGINAHLYLQKFINIETNLPKRKIGLKKSDLDIYSRKLLQLHELEVEVHAQAILNSIVPLGNHLNLSLRQLEKCFTNIALFYSTRSHNQLIIEELIVFLSVVKVYEPSLFLKLQHKETSYKEVGVALGLPNIPENEVNQGSNRRFFSMLILWVRYCTTNILDIKSIEKDRRINIIQSRNFNHSFDRTDIIPYFCNKLSLFEVD
ncbi:MAG: P-loop NTPase fold protein [Pseudomonadota bacterium]